MTPTHKALRTSAPVYLKEEIPLCARVFRQLALGLPVSLTDDEREVLMRKWVQLDRIDQRNKKAGGR